MKGINQQNQGRSICAGRDLAFFAFLSGALLLAGCGLTSQTEQRVVELPAGNPKTSLDTAGQIGRKLITGGLGAEIKKKFPSLTEQQLQGPYLTWNEGDFQGKKSVFFLTGIRYTGTLPEAKTVADYCALQVRKAIVVNFITPTGIHKMDFPNGDSALVMEYQTDIPIDKMEDLRGEVNWIWEAFAVDVENAGLKNGVIRAVHPNGAGLVTTSKGYGFVFVKRDDGKWHCLQDEKK